MNQLLLVFFGLFILLVGCSGPEEEEKIDLDEIKENRTNLDYGGEEDDLFSRLDSLLRDWQQAQRSKDHANIQSSERTLRGLALGQFSKLVETLESNDTREQIIAATTLGFSEDIRAIAYLLEMLNNSNAMVRGNAAMSIGHIGSPETPMEDLLKVLKEDPEDRVRTMVAFAIFRIIDPEEDQGALPHLLEALKDTSPGVRNHALIALGKIGDEECSKAIIATTLNDEALSVRYNSIRTLGIIADNQAIVPLIQKLDDENIRVKQAAASVLVKLTGENFGLNKVKWEEWAGVK